MPNHQSREVNDDEAHDYAAWSAVPRVMHTGTTGVLCGSGTSLPMHRGEVTLRRLLAPIEDLLRDPAMVEIVIQRPGEVGYERAGEWGWREVPEFTYQRLDAIGLLAAGLMGKCFDPAHPICLTHLPRGERYTTTRAPATDPETIAVSIRVPNRAQSEDPAITEFNFDELMRGAANRLDRGPSDADRELRELHAREVWREFFPLAVKTRKTIGVTGMMRSGKTTFLNRRILPHIDPEERVVTIQDTPEFALSLRNWVSLYFGAAGITAQDCFEATLRLRADRVLFQELRAGEVMAFLQLEASGHGGSCTTWHAEQGDPFTRLVLMAKTSTTGQSYERKDLEQMLRAFIDIVVHCHFDPVTKRYSVPSVYFRGAQ